MNISLKKQLSPTPGVSPQLIIHGENNMETQQYNLSYKPLISEEHRFQKAFLKICCFSVVAKLTLFLGGKASLQSECEDSDSCNIAPEASQIHLSYLIVRTSQLMILVSSPER